MQKAFYEKLDNPMYDNDKKVNKYKHGQLLVKELDGQDKIALEFGCGLGRNIALFGKRFKRIDGADISTKYISKCRQKFPNSNFYVTNGIRLNNIPAEAYDLVFSITVLQHIPIYDIRFNLLKEIYRVLKNGGWFSAQMGFGERGSSVDYYENYFDAPNTNSACDVRVEKVDYIKKDLENIGFKNFEYKVVSCIDTGDSHQYWIFFRGQR